jgi:hypothetical protein
MKRILKTLAIVMVFSTMFLIIAFKSNRIPDPLYNSFKLEYNRNHGNIANKEFGIIVDYRKTIFQKRLWLIDLKTGRSLLNCHVAQANRSGWIIPYDFSNIPGSEKSCAGSFVTAGSKLSSRYGKVIILRGLDIGKNEKATERLIYIHSTIRFKFCGIEFPEWLCWYSKGCYMIPGKILKQVMNTCEKGCFLYVYSYSRE